MESTTVHTDSRAIFVKHKTGVDLVQPFIDINNPVFSIKGASHVKSSKNVTAIINEGKVAIYDNETLEVLKDLEYEQVKQLEFSPTLKHIVIIQNPQIQNNLKIISLDDYSVKYAFHSTLHPNFHWPQIKFSSNEEYIFKITKSVLDIYKFDSTEDQTTPFGTVKDVINYAISEIVTDKVNEIALVCGRVVFDEKIKKKKSVMTFYKVSDLSKPIKEMNMTSCDRIEIRVSPSKSYVLIQSISDDTTSSSYYGASSLYYLDLLYGKFSKVQLPEGPIHDFAWTPNGKGFVTIAGDQPAKAGYYDHTAKLIKNICQSKISRIKISPDNRFLLLAGFNLGGDLEIYNLSNYSLIGYNTLYCGIEINWSSDSKYLLGAVLSPRIRVDNEFKIFTYNGEAVNGFKYDTEVYEVEWVESKNYIYSEFVVEINKESLKNKEKKDKSASSLSKTFKAMSFEPTKNIPGLKKK